MHHMNVIHQKGIQIRASFEHFIEHQTGVEKFRQFRSIAINQHPKISLNAKKNHSNQPITHTRSKIASNSHKQLKKSSSALSFNNMNFEQKNEIQRKDHLPYTFFRRGFADGGGKGREVGSGSRVGGGAVDLSIGGFGLGRVEAVGVVMVD